MSILHGRPDLPIYLAALGPRNVALTVEIADGWLPFILAPAHYSTVYEPIVRAGLARRSPVLPGFEIAPIVPVSLGPDVRACRDKVKPFLALYIGGMGAPNRNFYFDLVCRYGYEEAAATIQRHFLQGDRRAAVAAVPDQLIDDIALCGPHTRIAECLSVWMRTPVTMLNLSFVEPNLHALRTLAELVS